MKKFVIGLAIFSMFSFSASADGFLINTNNQIRNVKRFTTDCNNASCVRRYSNGRILHFTACINPADLEPMINAPIVDGIGQCSGTDASGNFYGMGTVQ